MSSERLSKITLAKRMREASKHSTQLEMSKKLSIGQSTISKYFSENSDVMPSLDTIYSFALECRVSVDWLLGLTENMELINYKRLTIDYPEAFQCLETLFIQGHLYFDFHNYNDYIRDPIFHYLMKIALIVRSANISMYNDWKENTLIKYKGMMLLNLPKNDCLLIDEKLNSNFSDDDLINLYNDLLQKYQSKK